MTLNGKSDPHGYWEEIEESLRRTEMGFHSANGSDLREGMRSGFEADAADGKRGRDGGEVPEGLKESAAAAEMLTEHGITSAGRTEGKEELFPTEKGKDLQRRLESSKNRYIVGKIAGSDLIDREGHPIVRNGEKITEETVQKADQAGKLVELILHMRFPGMEDER